MIKDLREILNEIGNVRQQVLMAKRSLEVYDKKNERLESKLQNLILQLEEEHLRGLRQ